MVDWFLFLLILFPLIIALIISIIPIKFKKYLKFVPAFTVSINLLLLISMSHLISGSAIFIEIPFLKLAILIDKLSFIFTMLITVSTVLVSISNISRFEEESNSKVKIINLVLPYVGTIYLCIAGDILSLMIASVLITSSIFMSLITEKNIRAIEAGFRYLFIGIISMVLSITGFILIYKITGSSNIFEIANAFTTTTLKLKIFPFVLLLSGVALESGIFPFSTIISEIHYELPEILSPLIPPAIIGTQLYIITRLTVSIFNFEMFLPYLALISILTIIFSETLALLEKDTKKILLHSIYAEAGLVLLSLSIFSIESISSSLLILVNSTFAVSFLFLINNAFTYSNNNFTDTIKNKSHWKILIFFSLISILSIVGFPPFIGFFAKFSLIVSLLDEVHWKMALFTAIVIFMVISEGIYLMRILGKFLKATKEETNNDWYCVITVIIFGLLILTFSLLLNSLTNFTNSASLELIQGFKYLHVTSLKGIIP
jgi:formate hydrogenlyase subunit 3/multisubunit Na+/H+ antiporter MnhD subunit